MWFIAPESLLVCCATPRTTQEMNGSFAFPILLLHIGYECQVGNKKMDYCELNGRGSSHDSGGDIVM